MSARRDSLLGDEPGAFAVARFVRVTPMKARRVVDMVRGAQVDDALATLKFAPQAASETVYKVLESAVSNATTTEGLERGTLVDQQGDGRRRPDAEAVPPARPGPRQPHPQAHQPHHARRTACRRPTLRQRQLTRGGSR